MRIDNYIRSILPNFEKRKVLEDLRGASEEYNKTTIPAYKQAGEVFRSGRFNSTFANDFQKAVKVHFPRERGSFITYVHSALKTTQDHIDGMITTIDREYSQDIMRDGLSYLMANQLQYIELVRFMSNYSRRLLLFMYSVEVDGDEMTWEDASEAIRERKWLDAKMKTFLTGLSITTRTPAEMDKAMSKIPNMTIDPERMEAVKATVGASKIDPLGFGLIPLPMNPVYHVRMAYTQWQVKRHTLLQEEKKQLEFKLLFLKQAREGKRDAKLEQQIEYNEMRIEKLRYKLQKMETDNDG